MGVCVRVFVLIFLLIFTACAVCSSLFAQFRVKKGNDYLYMYLFNLDGSTYSPNNVKVDYWHITGDLPTNVSTALSSNGMTPNGVGSFPTKLILPTQDAFKDCSDRKNYFLASGALAIAGAAFGGLATLLAVGHLCTTANCCLACSILLFCLVAFACMAVSFALMVTVYLKKTCGTKSSDGTKFSDSSNLVEGFGLSVAACGGFLITAFIELCA